MLSMKMKDHVLAHVHQRSLTPIRKLFLKFRKRGVLNPDTIKYPTDLLSAAHVLNKNSRVYGLTTLINLEKVHGQS